MKRIRRLGRALRAAASAVNVMDVTRALMQGADQQRRWREAVDVAKTLPISPHRARQLLDGGLTPEQVRNHVAIVMAMGGTP